MLPEEQLFRVMRDKRAGLFDLYNQQSNLGGKAFSKDEDPLTSLLGKDFNDKYRKDYEDTLSNTWSGQKNRLTSTTGARLLNDLNEMNDRGLSALHGLTANKDKALSWIKNITNSRVGVGGYTQEAADKDFAGVADKINMAARLRNTGDIGLFNDIANKYVKGQFGGIMDSLSGAMSKVPAVAKPFVTDISKEFRKPSRTAAALPPNPMRFATAARRFDKAMHTMKETPSAMNPDAKVQTTTESGSVDQSTFNSKKDNKNSFGGILGALGGALQGSGSYILPALLLGMLGGGLNKARGGSFLMPMLLMTLLGGAYGIGRKRGIIPGNTMINSTVDAVNNKMKDFSGKVYNSIQPYAKTLVQKASPYVTGATNYAKDALNSIKNKFTKTSEYEPTVYELIQYHKNLPR